MRNPLILATFFSAAAFAEDGLFVKFTIEKSSPNQRSTYTSGVLMGLSGSATLKFPGQYEMRIESHSVNDGNVDMVVTLKDLLDGKPMYAGSNAVTMKIGESNLLSLRQLPTSKADYKVFLDTSYGEMPESVR